MKSTIKSLEKTIEDKISEQVKLFELRKPLDEKISGISSDLRNLREELSVLKVNSDMSFEEKIEYFLFEDGYSCSSTRHNAAIKFIIEQGFYLSGYYPFSNQKVIYIQQVKGIDSNLQQSFENMSKFLPYIKPMDAEGNKLFPIMSAYDDGSNSASLNQSKDGEWSLVVGYRKRATVSFSNLLEALTYCNEHYFYISSEIEDNEDN